MSKAVNRNAGLCWWHRSLQSFVQLHVLGAMRNLMQNHILHNLAPWHFHVVKFLSNLKFSWERILCFSLGNCTCFLHLYKIDGFTYVIVPNFANANIFYYYYCYIIRLRSLHRAYPSALRGNILLHCNCKFDCYGFIIIIAIIANQKFINQKYLSAT